MFRSLLFIQYAIILAISFVSGVICFQVFPLDKSMKLISYIDPRLLDITDISIWGTILPLVAWLVLVLFFATHSYLHVLSKFVVGVKITFFGFSSVFLLTQHESLLIYSVWWFPFQLIYSFLLFLFCSVYTSKKVGPTKKYVFSQRLFVTLLIVLTVICVGEIVSITYILPKL
ncbi:MAG TPA: hypothetical protein VNS08_11930 [Ureibacillus sp.]|nr:hypothetical protein [Ureibacillus sp.]